MFNDNSFRSFNRNNSLKTIRPPQFSPNIQYSHKFRFSASSAKTAYAVTIANLFGVAGVFTKTANSTVCPVNASFKLTSVSVWGPITATGTPVTVTVEWLGANNSPNKDVSDTSVTNSFAAYLTTKPPRNSIASFWQVATASSTIFLLTCPSGSVIDVTMNLIMADQSTALQTVNVTTAAVGQSYYLALDHPTAQLVPVSLTTTT